MQQTSNLPSKPESDLLAPLRELTATVKQLPEAGAHQAAVATDQFWARGERAAANVLFWPTAMVGGLCLLVVLAIVLLKTPSKPQ